MTFKRYMVFAYSEFYPSGGISDMVNSFHDLKDAEECFADCCKDYVYIFDRVDGVIICER